MNLSTRAAVLIGNDQLSFSALDTRLSFEFDVVAHVHDNLTLVAEALRLRPDLILLDVAMALRDEFRAAKEIMRLLPATKIIFHTLCRQDSRELAQAVRLAAAEEQAVGRLQSALTASTASVRKQAVVLTNREHEILALLANGFAMKVIAYQLGITYRTVTFHKYRMMERLGIRANAGLTAYALQTGALKLAVPRAGSANLSRLHERVPAIELLRANHKSLGRRSGPTARR